MAEVPDWLETPDPVSYSLMMEVDGDHIERHEVQVTREEFIKLKRLLAGMRGQS
jgi:hypothetical protein